MYINVKALTPNGFIFINQLIKIYFANDQMWGTRNVKKRSSLKMFNQYTSKIITEEMFASRKHDLHFFCRSNIFSHSIAVTFSIQTMNDSYIKYTSLKSK